MKKLFILLFVATAVTFSACGGAAKTEEKPAEVAVEEVAVVATESIVDQYAALMTKSVELTTKAQAGDKDAVAELATVSTDVAKFLEDNKEALANLSEEDKAKFTEVATKVAEAAMATIPAVKK